MASAWARYRQAQLKRHFLPLIVEAALMDHIEFKAPPRELIDGWLWGLNRSDLFARAMRDAIAKAKADKRFGDADSYRGLAEQFGDIMATYRR